MTRKTQTLSQKTLLSTVFKQRNLCVEWRYFILAKQLEIFCFIVLPFRKHTIMSFFDVLETKFFSCKKITNFWAHIVLAFKCNPSSLQNINCSFKKQYLQNYLMVFPLHLMALINILKCEWITYETNKVYKKFIKIKTNKEIIWILFGDKN